MRFRARTSGFSASWFNVMLLDLGTGRTLTHVSFDIAADQDWVTYDFTTTTAEGEEVALYLGAWDSSEGSLWFDGVEVLPGAAVNLVRRDDLPVTVRDDAGIPLVEETDVGRIDDPLAGIGGIFDDWHTPPALTVPVGSRLTAGDRVTVDYHTTAPIHGYQNGACLTTPGVAAWVGDNLPAVVEAFPDAAGLFMQHDEMRHLNTCATCRALGLDAGALLASHMQDTIASVRSIQSGHIFVWSDMFDPLHNAVPGPYYRVEGDLSGSWEGVDTDVVIMNWNGGARPDSLAWFAERGHPQIVAGYYDSGDGSASGEQERADADSVEGLVGYMYTTWWDDYSQLEAYAAAIGP